MTLTEFFPRRRSPLGVLLFLFLGLTGCDDAGEKAMFLRPRLTQSLYLIVRPLSTDPSQGEVELLNLSDQPLKIRSISSAAIHTFKPSRDLSLAPLEPYAVGRIQLSAAEAYVTIVTETHFPQMFAVTRNAIGLIQVKDDPAGAEGFVRVLKANERSARRWGVFFTVLKIGGAVAIAAAAVYLGVRKWKKKAP